MDLALIYLFLWLILACDKQITVPPLGLSHLHPVCCEEILAGRLAVLGLTVSHGPLLLMPTTALSKTDVTESQLCVRAQPAY